MWEAVLILSILIPYVQAWQAVYNANYSLAFVQSTNGSVYEYQINDKNKAIASQDIASSLTEIQHPPSLNASLVIDANNNLLAVWGSQCGSSPIEISRYDTSKSQWVSVAQSSSGDQQNWFQENHVVWIDQSANVIYIYGGSCNGVVSNGFYTYNIGTNSFSQVSPLPAIMPRKMASARAIPLDKYRTLIIGGHNENAWMSMQQFAIFGHGSWSFVPVSNYTDVDSRDDPLLLPLWGDGDSSITQILVIGGTVAGRKASPEIALLNYTTEMGWEFSVPGQNTDFSVDYAGFSIFSTLVSVNDSNTITGANTNTALSVQLYGKNNQDSWSQVQQVSVVTSNNNANGNTQASSGKSGHTAVIAIVSVLLPIIALVLVGICIWWWLRKRRERRLFLLPNERSRMREAPVADFGNRPDWTPGDLYRLPSSSTYASGRTQDSIKQDLRLAKQRRNLHVVNPDTDTDFGMDLSQCNESDIISFASRESSMIRPFDTRSTTSSRSASSNSTNSSHAIEIRDPED